MNKLNAVFLVFVLVMPLLVSTVIVIGSNNKTPVIALANTSEEEENETEESFDTFLTFYLSDFFYKLPNKSLLLTNFVLEKRKTSLLREVFSPPPEIV